jgi:competence protein ComEC
MNRFLLLLYGSICLLVFLRVILASKPVDLPDGAKITANVRIVSSPQVFYGHQEIPVTIKEQKVILILPEFSEYRYGDQVRISGILKKKVLDNKKTVYSIYFPSIQKVKGDMGVFYQAAGFVRVRVTEAFNRYLPPNEASLLLGVVLGVSSTVSKDLKLDFQTTGVTHVVAASGMNVTLLAGFLLPIFLRFYRRQHALLLTILCLFFYALISGLSASIVRATLMASISYIGLMVGRQRTAFISFFLTGSIMVLLSPSVISDIGFQLSFAATLGMLLISPLIPSFSKLPLIRLVEDDLKTTIAAQITTLPILLMYFHSFGLFSILVNTLVLWTIPPLMVVGSLASFVALISIQLGGILAFICLPLLSYFIATISFFASYSATMTISNLPLSVEIGYYLVVGGGVWWLRRHTKQNATQT